MPHTAIVQTLKKYVRATNYLTVAQLYLHHNYLLTHALTADDIKPRLLGHWGTCPGINFIYAQLNYLIKKHNCSMLFMLGPGHGFPALQANLFLEGTLQNYYPQATRDIQGIEYICKNFSWPYGFPSHTSPGTPGALIEGGELGYALSTAYGTILDNPDLITTCVIGDGEAETAATAASWHASKFIDPATNGAVIPILHLNGYKISGPTLFGRMTRRELKSLFYGYGYHPIFVEGAHIYEKMMEALEHAYTIIRTIQKHARDPHRKPKVPFARFPLIILKTPKGWTGIKKYDHKKLEGNNLSHQIELPEAKTNRQELKMIEKWLHSYHFEELFNAETGFDADILNLLPETSLRMGNNKHAYSGRNYTELLLPDIKTYAEDTTTPGALNASSMERAGLYIKELFIQNKKTNNLRLMSPDEIYSNKLDAVLQATPRAFTLPLKPWDVDLAPSGQVVEVLSEHLLQGLAQGYILTGRHALFASYEAFIEVISSMADQYTKFLTGARAISWRGDCSSLTYILTSSCWRQEHNGFSHQNPIFVSNMLTRPVPFVKAYFPPDSNSMLAVIQKCITAKNGINIITAGKTVEPLWLTAQLAENELAQGLMIWDFASDAHPDIVFASVGDYLTKEALAAVDILKRDVPSIQIRYVNILTLTSEGIGDTKLSADELNRFFTPDKPVLFNYHGYPATLKMLLFDQPHPQRFYIHGYSEEGSTTTPFDMMIRNKTSRYHLAQEALTVLQNNGVIDHLTAQKYIDLYQKKLKELSEYIKNYGIDPKEINEWHWKNHTSS